MPQVLSGIHCKRGSLYFAKQFGIPHDERLYIKKVI
jgi:hypothetical protein